MKRVDLSVFPQLRSVFSGYLHEDFLQEHANVAAAMQAFEKDADEDERVRFRAEAARFLDATKDLDFEDVRALLARLGAAWTPSSREALVAALAPRRRKR